MKGFKFFFIIFVLLIFITGLNAENLITYKLKNGLTVILYKKKGLPIVNVNVVYKVGCKDEHNGITGIAHMLEHMNFRGSKNFKDGFIEKFITNNGGIENATTSFDFTKYYVTINKKALPTILKIYADNMHNLLIDNSKFQKERNVVYQERLWRTDNSPDGYLYYTLNRIAYLEAPYRWTPIGFASDILHWSRDDVYNFYKKYYNPSNATLVIVGDFNIKKTKRLIKNSFGKIKGKKINFYFTKEPEQKGERRVTLKFVSSNKKLAIAFHIPALSEYSTPVLDIITYMLFARDNAILEKILVREKKLASSVYGGNNERLHTGLFYVFATLNKGVEFKDVESIIYNEFEKLKNGKFSKEDFELSKKRALIDYIYSKETVTSLGNMLSFYGGLGRLQYYKDYPSLIKNVTKKDIIEISRKYFNKSNRTVVELYPIEGKSINYTPPISGGIR